jgi:O-antigen/teichoic acid export membrane protein
MNRFGKNVIAGAVGFGLPTLAMLLSFPALIHDIGISRFGILQLAQAFGNGTVFLDLGMTNATVFYIAKYSSERKTSALGHVIGTSISTIAVMAVISATLILVFAPRLPGLFKVEPGMSAEAVATFRLSTLQICFIPVVSITCAYFKGVHRFDRSAAILCVMSLFTWGLAALFAWLFHFTLVQIASTFVAGTFVSACFAVTLFFRDPGAARFDRRTLRPLFSVLREMWRYSAAAFSQGIAVLLNNQLQRLLVGAVLGPAFVGVYVTALQLTTKVHAGLAATFEAFFPIAVSTRDSAELRRMYRRVQGLSLLLGGAALVPLALFAHFVCRVWLGGVLAQEVAPLVRVLCVGTFAMVAAIPAYHVINAAKRPWVNVIFMAANVVLAFTYLGINIHSLDVKIFVDAYAMSAVAVSVAMIVFPEIALLRTWSRLHIE